MKKRPWILFVICVAIFIALRLLAAKKNPADHREATRPAVPEPVLVHQDLLSHPWVRAQPKITELNVEIVRDLTALNLFCEQVQQQRKDFTSEQVLQMLVGRLTALQEQVPFRLPESYYNVLCISETPQEWVDAPVPFHVYKRLYLGEMEMGLPFYLDVRVFDLDGFAAEELITWHVEMLDGESICHSQTENRQSYTVFGKRTRDTAHGFARGERGLFIDCLQKDGRLYVLYAEAPIQTYSKQEQLFNQLARQDYD